MTVMRNLNALLISLCVAAPFQAFAADPPAVDEKAAVAESAAAAPAPAAPASLEKDKAAANVAAAKPAADEDAAAKERDKRMLAMGYKRATRDGVTVYCRKEAVIGTRFSRMNCSTAEVLERTAENAQDETERMVRRSLNQLPSN